MKIKCDKFKETRAKFYLTEGEEYPVVGHINDDCYIIIDDHGDETYVNVGSKGCPHIGTCWEIV